MTKGSRVRRAVRWSSAVECMAVAPAALAAQAIHAQASIAQSGADQSSAATSTAGEIIVTANRRAETVQNANQSITALSGTQLQAAGLVDL